MRPIHKMFLTVSLGVVIGLGYFLYQGFSGYGERTELVLSWLNNPQEHVDWAVKAGDQCLAAPFILPTDGFIGYLWDDSFQIGQRHTGLDIFAGTSAGKTPVVAAFDSYVTRLKSWKSALILRIPEDPLQPDRQIWLYYTHMADEAGNSFIVADFPPGTRDVFVKAGTVLGYQGDYNGDSTNRVAVHLHFSIVADDGNGQYLNETEIANTLDPSPYFNLPLNAKESPESIPVCESFAP